MSETLTGKLLVLHDEYMLSDHAIQQAPDTETFINNIAKVLTDGKGGRFLDASTYYTTNPTVQGTALEKSLSSPPYAFKRDRSASLDLNTLRNYEVVFIGGEQVDNQMLIDYIKLGGSVCVIAGTGHGGSESEAAGWNQLLAAFGLRLESSYNDITGVRSVTSSTHPLFAGVNSLYQYWGQTVKLLPDSKASIIMTADSQGLIGYAEFTVDSLAKVPSQSLPDALKQGGVIKLKSWKGDFLHRPDTPQGVTTWHTGVGNEWTVEVIAGNKIRLRSWKGDFLHRPDSAQGVTSWNTGIGNEWDVEVIAGNKIQLRSWKNDFLHRPDSPQDVTTWGTGIGNEWVVEAVSPVAS
ncbi:MAG: hypothetical protein ACK5N0_00890 [Synechococcaceae cyanobacterium]